MALHPLRLRRALSAVTSLHRSLSASSSTVRGISIPQFQSPTSDPISPNPVSSSHFAIFQSRSFRSSASLSSNFKVYKEGDEITPDTVLFEGCDFNHWLITVDFPKDNKPPPAEMVRTYEEICAKGLKISVEEAKKRIYACSTTTYEGFQAIMTEEESKKFEDIPGVVFVLPDSYIDPANKEYGGDKYENGVITPRPPPTQYGGGKYRDRRNYDQQRAPHPNQQGNFPPNQQGHMQREGRNFAPQQNYQPQQNYSPQPPMNNPTGRGPMPSYQGNYNQGGPGNYNPQERRNFPPGPPRNYAPAQGGNFGPGPNPGYGQNYPGQGTGQGGGPGFGQTYGQGVPQGPGQGYGQGSIGQGAPQGPGQGYVQGNIGQGAPNYGQGASGFGQGNTGPGAPDYGHGVGPGQGVGPGFSQGEQRIEQGVQPTFPWGKQG